MAKRGRKKQPLPEQSNKILSYLNRNTTLGVRGIIDELINGMDFRNEAETVVSDIIGNIISDIPETESKSKHSGETVSQDTLESWKNKYPWLTINKVSDNHMRLICDYCSSAKRKLPLTNVWAFEGSPSIQSSSLVRHNASVEHKDAVSHLVKLEPWSKSQNEQSECIVEQSKNTDPIKPEDILVFNTVYYAAKEQEPSEKVNRLLALQKKNGLNTEYQNLSWSTIDNIQESICSVMTKALVDEINSSPSFALMLDESTDITVDKRLSICVRYVKFGVPVTKFLINVPLVDGRAHTIVNSVVQQCIDLGIDLTKMTSLATDGASVMMGHKTGVGVQMKSKHSPFSIQTHCIAHRLNLACTDSIKKEDYLVTFRDKFDSLYHFMSSSPARVYALKQIQQVLEEPELSIKEPHSIRWLGLKTAVEAVYECYASVLSVLSKFAAEKNAVAKGLYKYFCSYKVALVIAFMLDVHSELAILSQQFQRKNLMFSMVQPLIDGTVSKLDVLSNTDGEGLKQMKRDILASDEGKQYKGEKLGFKVTMDDEFNNLRTRYIKSLKHNVKHRLRKDDGDILSDFSKVFEPFTVCNTAEEACNDAITHLSNFYGTGKEITRLEGDLIEGTEETVIPVHAMLDQDKLLDEWPRLIGMIRGAYSNEDPQELCRKLIVLHSDVMPNVSILAAIGLCMQLTSVECERSFSVQNRLKSKFRASIKSEKLQCLIQISMLGPAMESYEPEAAIRHWLSAKKRRKGRLFSPYEPRPAKKQKIEDSYRKHVKVGTNDILLDILDTAGQGDYAALREQYYRAADVIIIMYSVTNLQSFENVRQYHDAVCRVKDSTAVPFILAGMKDRSGDTTQVTFNEGLRMSEDIKARGFFECSAQTGVGIEELFQRTAVVGLPGNEKYQFLDIRSELNQRTDYSVDLFNEILKQGMEENHDIRVMFVGQAAVGKTTLTRRLLKLPVNLKEYNSTNGVDVHINSCDIEIDSGKWVIKKQDRSFRKKLMILWTKRIKRHKENAEKSKITGYRDFHLRCAKLIGKVTKVPLLNYSQEASSQNESTSDFDNREIGNPTGVSNYIVNDGTDTEKHDKTENKPGRFFRKPKKMIKTMSTLKSNSMSDIELTLQQAASLPSESSTRLAKVSLYDFAGQYIFHASHPTFLSPQAIYILVFNLNKLIEWKGKTKKMDQYSNEDEEQYYEDCRGHSALGDRESIFFWLNVIYLFAALKQNIKPQVILVGTHFDKLPKAERHALIEKLFRDLRCEIAATPLKELVSNEYVVDNSKKDDSSFSDIQSEIFRLAKQQPNWGKMTPSKWLPLEREMQGLKESGLKVLSMEELIEINSGLDLQVNDEIEMEMLLQFLHNTGEIIFFSEKGLRNFIVLDPVWLIDALKLIITSDRFAVRIPKLAEKWINFYKTGVIYRSTIVGIFEERTEDPALYENHEHVLLLMEKFLFIAAPVEFPDEVAECGSVYEEVDTCYIMPCMVHKEIDTTSITSPEGTCGTSVLCLVSINHFLPPAVFHKLLAICIKKWPIVEQHGQKLIFCGVCKFNLDESRNYKLTLFQVGYAVHARVVSYCREEHLPQAVCGSVYEFLVQSLRSVLKGMGFSDKFRICIQCPSISALENSGYIDMSVAEGQDGVTCDDCHVPHHIQSQKLLEGWIKRSSENSNDNYSDDVARCVPANVVSLESAVIGDQCLGAVGGTDPEEIDDSTDGDVDDGAVSFIDNAPEDDDSAKDQEYNGVIDIGPFTQEHMNYARLCNVIVTLGADALRDVLVTQVPLPYADIYRALLGHIAAIRAMRQIGREQFKLIFQDPQFRYTGTVDQFDITLLYTLIRNISSCPAPATGWGKPPDDLPRDVSLGACVERIRLIRNKISGHSADGKLADQAYEDHMAEINQILDDICSRVLTLTENDGERVRDSGQEPIVQSYRDGRLHIEVVLGDHGYKDALEKCRKQIITTQEAQALRKKFENYQQHLKDSRDAVVEAYETFKEIMNAKVEQLSTAIDQNI